MNQSREILDLSGVPCPRNTAQALLKLELLDDGEELEILVDDGEPVTNMLSSFEIESNLEILKKEQGGAIWRVIVQKKGQ